MNWVRFIELLKTYEPNVSETRPDVIESKVVKYFSDRKVNVRQKKLLFLFFLIENFNKMREHTTGVSLNFYRYTNCENLVASQRVLYMIGFNTKKEYNLANLFIDVNLCVLKDTLSNTDAKTLSKRQKRKLNRLVNNDDWKTTIPKRLRDFLNVLETSSETHIPNTLCSLMWPPSDTVAAQEISTRKYPVKGCYNVRIRSDGQGGYLTIPKNTDIISYLEDNTCAVTITTEGKSNNQTLATWRESVGLNANETYKLLLRGEIQMLVDNSLISVLLCGDTRTKMLNSCLTDSKTEITRFFSRGHLASLISSDDKTTSVITCLYCDIKIGIPILSNRQCPREVICPECKNNVAKPTGAYCGLTSVAVHDVLGQPRDPENLYVSLMSRELINLMLTYLF